MYSSFMNGGSIEPYCVFCSFWTIKNGMNPVGQCIGIEIVAFMLS